MLPVSDSVLEAYATGLMSVHPTVATQHPDQEIRHYLTPWSELGGYTMPVLSA